MGGTGNPTAGNSLLQKRCRLRGTERDRQTDRKTDRQTETDRERLNKTP